MIGKQIHHYKILEKLGAGGMGEVFLAEDSELKRKVALKFLPPAYSADSDFKARFKHEAQATAALNHPHIITVHDINEHQERMYLVLEHVPGRTLEEVIKDGKLKLVESLDLISQICEGLVAAHKAGVVHRDIKPSNILISDEGQAKILDFGLAKMSGVTKLTREGSTLGTLQYQSPEQSRGETVDERSDIFSVGVTLYEMITGHLPFEADYDVAIRYAIAYETPEPLARYKADTPDDLQRIQDKALAKDPAERYQTVADMLVDLRRVRRDSQPVGRSPIPPSLAKKSVSNSRLALIISGMVTAALVAGYFIFSGLESSDSTAGGASSRVMLAVLPFENLGSAEDEYFADGITDEITSRLAKLSGLGVISRTSSMRYKNTDKGLREIGKELGVDYVLEGTIRWDKLGDTDRVRITPQLIRVSDDTHLWANNYERALTRLFTVQADIAEHVVKALNVVLLGPERESLRKAPTANVEAYKLYLKGRSLFYTYSRSENEQAIEIFKTVVDMDSLFSLAFAGLSLCYSQYSNSSWDNDERWPQLAEESARHAIALDGGSAEAHFALGFVFEQQRDLENMEREMQRALEINPNHAHAHDGLGDIHSIRGELDDAIREFSAALTIDPFLLPSFWNKADVHLKQGRFRDARITLQKALLIDPEDSWALSALGTTYRMMGKFDESLVKLKKAIELRPDRFYLHLLLGLTHLERGSFPDARREANKIHDFTGSDTLNFEWNYLLGRISLQQGAFVDARKQLELILATETLSAINRSHAHLALGECFLQTSDFHAAIGEFNKVGGLPISRFQHDYPWAKRRYKLGICYEALGEMDSAMAEYETFLRLWDTADKDQTEIVDANARLFFLKRSGE